MAGQTVPGKLHDVCRDAALGDPSDLRGRDAGHAGLGVARGGMVQVDGVVLRVSATEGDARGIAILFVDVAPATATAIELRAPRGTDG
jgi:hypothetical protein